MHMTHDTLEGAAVASILPKYKSGQHILKANDAYGVHLSCHND